MYIIKFGVCVFGITQIQQLACISRNMRAAFLLFVILLLYCVISGFFSWALGQAYVQMAHRQGHTVKDKGKKVASQPQ